MVKSSNLAKFKKGRRLVDREIFKVDLAIGDDWLRMNILVGLARGDDWLILKLALKQE